MSLAGWTLPQTPTGRAATVPPPPWHYSGDIIAVDFTADPARVAELAPPGFSPRGDGSCTLFFCEWASAADRDHRVKDDPGKGQYKEAYVTLNGAFEGRPFGRVPYIWVDSELSLLRGMIQGFPKKLGAIHMTRPIEIGKGGSRKSAGERFAAHVSSLGRRLATAAVTLREVVTDALPGGALPQVHTRLWPSLERDEPAVHELSLVTVTDVEVGTVWRGDATLEFGASEFEEVELLAPRTVGPGWVYAMAFSVIGGKTLPLGGSR
jgi:Acetoacetate decarboxylase (ADC)